MLELGTWVAVPAACTILADLGATVTKIEHPNGGDPLRDLHATGLQTTHTSMNPLFALENRRKRSLAIDLAHPDSEYIAKRLLASSDVFVTNLRPRALARLQLDWDRARKVNRRLVYASLSGYGHHGPERHRGAYDYTAFWGRSGLTAALSDPAKPPLIPRPGVGDHTAALGLAAAVLGGLWAVREKSRSVRVHVSLLRTGLWANGMDVQSFLSWGTLPSFVSPAANPNPLFNLYRTRDRVWIQLVLGESQKQWPNLCHAIGRDDLIHDVRFATVSARAKHCRRLIRIIQGTVGRLTHSRVAKAFERHGLHWDTVRTVSALEDDAQFASAGACVTATLHDGSRTRLLVSPIEVGDRVQKQSQNVPRLGQHTLSILKQCGLDRRQIARLHQQGVVSW